MKKRLSYFLMAVLIVFSTMGGALAEAVPGIATNTSSISGSVLSYKNPESSLQLMFAKLQLDQAEIAKKQAMDRMEQIQKNQEEQKQLAGYLSEARQAQEDARNNAGTGDGTSDMPDAMKQYMDSNGLAYDKTGDDSSMTADEWNTAIKSLEEKQETLGRETQQQMVDVQNSIGQYNTYLEGVNTQIGNAQQTISSLARGMSLYGESDAGLAVTALVVGLVLGCVITLAAQKIGGKKGKT